ncbi:tigger transposable element-derived protein 4 [Elysia marginata]|uniref:Tigger transposable element-derived protein 4 n=1 Tax=Elysia marginata TaxID=1093978 RepID=A0AAV4GIN5_9GAST|nr:tigger transposable element-derived protein 4 [Elysia marginata]
MGIINNLKCHYRGTLLKRIINHVDEGNDFDNFKLTLLDAVIILKQAWEKVEPATIRNCFKKAGFQASETETEIEGENEIEAEDTDVQPFLSRLLVEYSIPDSLDDLENLDQDVPTAPSPSEEMNRSTTDSERENQTEQAADDEDDQGEEMPPVSDESVASAMETLSQYCMQRCLSDELLSKVKKTIEFQKVQSKKQTSLTSFLKPAPKNK